MAVLMGLMLAAAQAAEPAQGACPATAAALPAELAGWSRMVRVEAGASAGAATALTPGISMGARLLPPEMIHYVVPPVKHGSGGMFAFTAPSAGRYRVALGSRVWVDLIQGGSAAASVAHGMGPECSGIRKTVDFDLAAGPALLQVSGSAEQKVGMMVVRLP